MNETYRPNLADVAKLVGSTGGCAPTPEVVCLVYWLVERIPEIRDLWKAANEVRDGGITLLKIAELIQCLAGDHDSEEAHGTAVWLLRQVPETDTLWQQMEQMGRDCGHDLQYPAFCIDVLHSHDQVDRLLSSDAWTTAEEFLDLRGVHGLEYEILVNIVEARLARGEAESGRLAAVREKLRAEAALHRYRPLLEDQLDALARTFGCKKGREGLAAVLQALKTMSVPTNDTHRERRS